MRDQVEIGKQQWLHAEKGLRRLVRGDENEHRQGLSPRAAAVLGQAAEQWRRIDRELERLAGGLAADGRLFDQVFALDEEVRQVRMLPFSQACEGLERSRTTWHATATRRLMCGSKGGAAKLDRSILDGIKDPLRQLLRNAIDHGVEPPTQEKRAGSRPAQITITAAIHGNQVDVTVADDGAGIDFEALRSQVRRRGMAQPNDPRDLARLIFLPGLSTAPTLTEISGRGVGLDIVKSRIEALHGTIDLTSSAGTGTRFTMMLPFLDDAATILFKSNGQTYALAGVSYSQAGRMARARLDAGRGPDRGASRRHAHSPGRSRSIADRDAAAGATGKLQLVIVTAAGRKSRWSWTNCWPSRRSSSNRSAHACGGCTMLSARRCWRPVAWPWCSIRRTWFGRHCARSGIPASAHGAGGAGTETAADCRGLGHHADVDEEYSRSGRLRYRHGP